MAILEFELKSVEMNGAKSKLRKLGVGGPVQHIIDSETLRLMGPFVPFNTGELIDNGIRNTRIGSGSIIYSGPYARRLYYHPEFHFSEKGNSETGGAGRGGYWFERMKANGGKEQILKAAKGAAGKL